MNKEKFRSNIPSCTLGGVSVSSLSRSQTADLMIDAALGGRPDYPSPYLMASVDSRALSSQAARAAVAAADAVSTPSRIMTGVSKWFCKAPVPEPCCPVDLYHDVAKRAPEGLSFFLFGSIQDEIEHAAHTTKELYPQITISGWSHGYLSKPDEEQLMERLAELQPDILWIDLSLPKQQQFISRYRARLGSVRVVKTCSGLFRSFSSADAPVLLPSPSDDFNQLTSFWRYPLKTAESYLVSGPRNFMQLLAHSH